LNYKHDLGGNGGNRGNFHRRLACVSVSYFLFDPTKLLNVYEALHYRENILWLWWLRGRGAGVN
jgi:hypothetical protein